MKSARLLCLLVMAVVFAAVPTGIRAEPICCWDFAAWCSSQCTYLGGVYHMYCPFSGFEICVCNDYSSPSGGPDCSEGAPDCSEIE